MRNRKMAFKSGVAALALIAGGSIAAAGAAEPEELDEAEIYFETNATDGDVGIHAFLDGEGWREMNIVDETGKTIVRLKANGGAQEIGLTELFFESSEPSLAELSFAEHIILFPPGEYTFTGKTTDNLFIVGDAELTLDLPCPPTISTPEEEEELTLGSVEIEWAHNAGFYDPDTDTCDDSGDDVDLASFEVAVEYEYEDGEGEEVVRVFSVTVEPGVTSVTIPDEFLEEGVEEEAEFKVEVLAIEESGNRTITEVEFEVAEPE